MQVNQPKKNEVNNKTIIELVLPKYRDLMVAHRSIIASAIFSSTSSNN
jgi:hypothetical protein